jgi:Holliday junction resolvase
MSQYRRGADFERRVRIALETDGYEVIRSAGSKGVVDLVCFKGWPRDWDVDGPAHLLFVQCKRVNGTIPPSERAELHDYAGRIGALAVVAYQPKPRQPIAYRRLTGPGAKDWQPWTPDEVAP